MSLDEYATPPSAIDDAAAQLAAAGCVWAHEEARILARAAGSHAQLAAMLARRCAGEPLEYVVGYAEFCGVTVRVAPGVFIPRRRTEYLARCAVALSRCALGARGHARVLDLCCGSGAIALVIARRVPGVELWAADISPDATACAARNLAGLPAVVCTGDLFDALPPSSPRRFDVIVANVPYVPATAAHTLPTQVREYEPTAGWSGGADGLAVHRALLGECGRRLAPDGVVLTETSRSQAPALLEIAERSGFSAQIRRLEALDATILVAHTR